MGNCQTCCGESTVDEISSQSETDPSNRPGHKQSKKDHVKKNEVPSAKKVIDDNYMKKNVKYIIQL